MLRDTNSKSNIQKVGIVGQGKMGSGIFNYLLDFNFDLVWVCSSNADTDKLNKQFVKKIKRLLNAGIIDHQRFDWLMRTSITPNLDDLQYCDLIIEAVPEIPELKKGLFLQLDQIVQPEAIFTSNSSSIHPSELSPPGNRSGLFAGLHFFYPVPLKNIVEFTLTANTTINTTATVESFLESIHRRFIILDEQSSFMLNKIFLDVQNEAFMIVQTGHCSQFQMDQLVRKYLFPFGVFDFCDSVGIDTMLASIRNYTRGYPHKEHFSALISALQRLVNEGKFGVKSQEGFFKYPIKEIPAEEPVNTAEIVEHLRQTWLTSSKQFTARAHIPIDDANYAIREYFDLPKGPFE